jgi:hypothetical protein
MSAYLIHAIRLLGLTLALVMAQTVGGMLAHALLADTLPASFFSTTLEWSGIFTVAGVEAAAIYCLLTGLRVERKHQLWIVFAFYWGTKFFQMWIEAAFFLNIWQAEPIMSWPELLFMACYGTVTSVLFALPAVWIANIKPAAPREPLVLPRLVPALKIAAVYVPIYYAAGMLLAIPLAGEAFAATYADLQVPVWLPLFQFARGMLLTVILWLLIGNHRMERDSRVTVAVALGIVSSFQLLLPNPYMSELLRAAHLVEVLVSMAAFGWLAGWIFIKNSLAGLAENAR